MANPSPQRWYVSNPQFLTLFVYLFSADAGVFSLFREHLRTELEDRRWFMPKRHMSFLENVALARMKGEY